MLSYYKQNIKSVGLDLLKLFETTEKKKNKAFLRCKAFLKTHSSELDDKYLNKFSILDGYKPESEVELNIRDYLENYHYSNNVTELIKKEDFVINQYKQYVEGLLTSKLSESGNVFKQSKKLFKTLLVEIANKFTGIEIVACVKGSMTMHKYFSEEDKKVLFKNSDFDSMIAIDYNNKHYYHYMSEISNFIVNFLNSNVEELFENIKGDINKVCQLVIEDKQIEYQPKKSFDYGIDKIIFKNTSCLRVQRNSISINSILFELIRVKACFNYGNAEIIDIVIPYSVYGRECFEHIVNNYTKTKL